MKEKGFIFDFYLLAQNFSQKRDLNRDDRDMTFGLFKAHKQLKIPSQPSLLYYD